MSDPTIANPIVTAEPSGALPHDRWLQTWLLVHFGKGTALIREELEELKDDPLRWIHGDVFRLLVAPPEDRFKLLMSETGLWRLEVDDTDD